MIPPTEAPLVANATPRVSGKVLRGRLETLVGNWLTASFLVGLLTAVVSIEVSDPAQRNAWLGLLVPLLGLLGAITATVFFVGVGVLTHSYLTRPEKDP